MRPTARLLGILFCGLLPLGPAEPAFAAQTSFASKYVQNVVQFDFAWNAPPAQSMRGIATQQLSFSLPIADVEQGKREFEPFDNKAANEYAFDAVRREAALASHTGLEISVKRHGSGYEIIGMQRVPDTAGSKMDEKAMEPIMTRLRKTRDAALDDYLKQAFYMRVDDVHIMPDHKRIAERYAPALAPVAREVARRTMGMSQREQINWLLGFLQNIPYDELLDRYSSNGAGFQTPYGLFLGNLGDCDTKSVALAALLRSLYPSLRLVMIYVPGHAFIGIGLPQGRNDYALRLEGVPFVLADPTGPRALTLGEVDEKALKYVNTGTFSYQEIR